MIRDRLIPDTNGDLGAATDALEELLIALATDEELSVDDESFVARLPIVRGRDALSRINLARARAESESHRRLFAPDGRFELVPLYRVALDDDDVADLGSAVATLGEALLPTGEEVLAETIRMDGAPWSPRRRRRDGDAGPDVVARAAAVHAVYELPPDGDTQLLLALLSSSGSDCVLGAATLAAYERFTWRFLSIWNLDFEGRADPLERFVFDAGRPFSRLLFEDGGAE